jgi:hypothetical protein
MLFCSWVVTPCGCGRSCRRFGGTCCLQNVHNIAQNHWCSNQRIELTSLHSVILATNGNISTNWSRVSLTKVCLMDIYICRYMLIIEGLKLLQWQHFICCKDMFYPLALPCFSHINFFILSSTHAPKHIHHSHYKYNKCYIKYNINKKHDYNFFNLFIS